MHILFLIAIGVIVICLVDNSFDKKRKKYEREKAGKAPVNYPTGGCVDESEEAVLRELRQEFPHDDI